MKISCKCLNVIIESNGSTIDEVDVSTLDIPKNDFFNEGVGTVELVGISKEQSVLVEVNSVGSWVIHRCLNCEMYTHALNRDKGAASLLVNKSLITDPDIIAELKKSENFSPVFHIVINYTDDDDVFTKVSGTGRHQAGIVALHQALTSFIQRESALTEERVRSYTDQQYAALENLRSRAHRDHRSLTKLLNETGYDGNVSSASTRTVTDSSNVNPNNINFITSSNNNRVVLAAASAVMKKPIIVPSTNKPKIAQNNTSTGDAVISNPTNKSDVINVSDRAGQSNNRRFSETGSQSNLSFDSEVLFPLEGMEDPASDNYHTDEERSDSDDSGSHDEGIHIPRGRVNSFVYAKSLPVNVPTFAQHTGGVNYDGVSMVPGGNGNDDFTSTADEPFSDHHRSPRQPMDIAASIKALAKSVHGDAVFGDLPRPRFSSQI